MISCTADTHVSTITAKAKGAVWFAKFDDVGHRRTHLPEITYN